MMQSYDAARVEPPVGAAASTGDACPNCGTALGDRYCGHCGQKRPDPDDLTMRALVAHAADEVLSADSKLIGTLRTLVVAPGALTVDWREGRRARWIAPLRLYLVTSAVYYLTVFDLTRAQTTAQFVGVLAKAAALTGWLSERTASANMEAHFETVTTITSFTGALSMAILAALCFRRARRPFAEHFVAMLHYSAFAWILGTAVYAITWWIAPDALLGWASAFLMLAGAVYLGVQIRRTERLRTGSAIGWTLVLVSANYVVEVFVMTFVVLASAFLPA
jgi:phosphatidylserine synthase